MSCILVLEDDFKQTLEAWDQNGDGTITLCLYDGQENMLGFELSKVGMKRLARAIADMEDEQIKIGGTDV